MEIELFLRESVGQMWFFSRKPGHPGSYRITIKQKLENDGKEEVVVCPVCEKAVLSGPAFKSDGCDSLFHISCLEVEEHLDPYLLTIIYHLGFRHELIFKQELENHHDGEEEKVVCFGCEEPVLLGPRYKCSASECNLLFHKSCTELPRKIKHPLYSTYNSLKLVGPRNSYHYCDVCGKRCNRCFCYGDFASDFFLDITCATRWQIMNAYDCQRHAFLPVLGDIHFTCQACGRQGNGGASICSICGLFIHGRCARFPRTIRITSHHHSLALAYSLSQRKSSDNLFCNICREKVNPQYAVYCCKVCAFITHLYCAENYWLTDETADSGVNLESLPEETIPLVANDSGEIQHFSHQHNLILSNEDLTDDKLCDGCMELIISAPFYSCMQCNFFLHAVCVQLPSKKRHPRHEHTLTLLSRATTENGLFCCGACRYLRHGFVYKCDKCFYVDFDVQCCSIPETLKHPGHQHPLFLALNSKKDCKACYAGYRYRGMTHNGEFVCVECDFSLCYKCVIRPLVARHKYDEHPLELTYVHEDEYEEYYCLICEKERNPSHWFYYCKQCDFSAHIQCILGSNPYIKIGSTYTDKNHQHPVTFVRKIESSPPCNACGRPFYDLALECTQCKFNVHGLYGADCLKKISNRRSGVMIRESETDV